MPTLRRPSLAFALALAALPLLAGAADAGLSPLGRELRVNRRIDHRQFAPVIAFAPSGRSVIAWENDQGGIRALFYGTDGKPSGPEVTLVASQGGPAPGEIHFEGDVTFRRSPAIAYAGESQLVVAWTEERTHVRAEPFFEHRVLLDQDVYVQRFGTDGRPSGEALRVNTQSSGIQHTPKLVAHKGGFAIVWEVGSIGPTGLVQTTKVAARFLNAAGTLAATETAVGDGQRAAAASSGGKLLVVWEADDASQIGISGRVLDGALQPLGAAFRINTDTEFRQARPAVTSRPGGDFFVAWQSEHPERWIGYFDLYGQMVAGTGTLSGPQKTLYRGTLAKDSPQIVPALASVPGGGMVLAYYTWKDTFGMDLAATELDSLGNPIGEAFFASEKRVRANARRLSLSADGNGLLVVTWESSDRDSGIAARRLSTK